LESGEWDVVFESFKACFGNEKTFDRKARLLLLKSPPPFVCSEKLPQKEAYRSKSRLNILFFLCFVFNLYFCFINRNRAKLCWGATL
jgi:hypothetical protein